MNPDALTPEQRLRRLQTENANYKETTAQLQEQETMKDWLQTQLTQLLLDKAGPQGLAWEIGRLSPAIQTEIYKDAQRQDAPPQPRFLILTVTREKGLVLTYANRLENPSP